MYCFFSGKFALDNRTGLLTLAKLVDRETVDFYQLDILATDLGPAANTASATVFVNITVGFDHQEKYEQYENKTCLRNLQVLTASGSLSCQ